MCLCVHVWVGGGGVEGGPAGMDAHGGGDDMYTWCMAHEGSKMGEVGVSAPIAPTTCFLLVQVDYLNDDPPNSIQRSRKRDQEQRRKQCKSMGTSGSPLVQGSSR